MKLKLQFWKTPNALYCCVLENKDTLFVEGVLIDDVYTGVLLNGSRIVIGKGTSNVDFIRTE